MVIRLSVQDVIMCLIGISVSKNKIYGTFSADEDLSLVLKTFVGASSA